MNHETCAELTAVFNNLEQFKELFSIGNYFVQPHVMHISAKAATETNSWHRHRAFEYSLLMSGRMRYQFENTEITMESGDAVIIPADIRHQWKIIAGEAVIFGFMLFISCQGEGARQHLNLLRQNIIQRKYQIKGFAGLADIVERIITAAQNRSGYLDEKIRCLSQEAYVEMFSVILPEPPITRKPSQTARQFRGDDPLNLTESINFYISDNLYRPLTPAEVSAHIGLSINHLNAVLRQHDGRSLGRIIWDRKMSMACNLLDNTNRQIKDIAASLGMEDVDYFCRRFKKSQGVSPTEYRLKKRN